MSKSTYPDPPHIDLSVYLLGLPPAETFARVCGQVVAGGGVATGALTVVRQTSFPQFVYLSDLAPKLERLPAAPPKQQPVDWQGQLAAAERQVLQAAFTLPTLGLAVVGFAPLSAPADAVHPIAVTVSGAELDFPAHVALSAKQRHKARRQAEALLALFRGLCDGLQPLYGGICVESELPTPHGLDAEGTRFGSDVFVGQRLLADDPAAQARLAAAFAGAFVERWPSGTFYSGWRIWRDDAQDGAPLVDLRRAASVARRELAAACARAVARAR